MPIKKNVAIFKSIFEVRTFEQTNVELRTERYFSILTSIVLLFFLQIRKPLSFLKGSRLKSATTYSPTIAVPSALAGLTSLFGMGRGGTPPL
jgi:hypothetical protein